MKNTFPIRLTPLGRLRRISVAFKLLSVFFVVAGLFMAAGLNAEECLSISDDPMETMVKAAPANIMFVLDDSGSMDWEFMTDDSDGVFEGNVEYVYDLNDHHYSSWGTYGTRLTGTKRLKWKSQWAGHNHIFYDPTVIYKPWPTMDDASTTTPRSNPMNATPTLNLGSEYTSLGSVSIKNAHYYVLDDADEDGEVDTGESIYLVNFYPTDSEKRKYFQVENVDSSGKITGTLTEVDETTLPDRVRTAIYDELGDVTGYKSAEDDLQNFANWFSYYRRRELTAKAAVGSVIYGVEGVWIGLYSINGQCRTEVLPVKVTAEESSGEVVIMDNGDNGYSEDGSWTKVSKFGGGRGGGRGGGFGGNVSYQYENDSRRTSTPGDTASWTRTFSKTSEYKVSVWWGCSDSFDPAAQYTIKHSGGTSTVTLDQTDSCGEWVELGTYDFDAGFTGSVTVERLSGSGHGTYTIADAVMFEDVGSGALVFQDDTTDLLDLLYNMDSDGGTALRNALKAVGQYFDVDDGSDGGIGDHPWQGEDDGGGCQQSFAIVMTDGYYNGGSPWVGNQDGGEGAPYADNYSNTLADVAMKYYNDDLYDALADEVPTNSCDDNDMQHLVTYSVAFGVHGTLTPYDADGDGVEDDPCFLGADTPLPDWPNPSDSDEKKIDDLWHAAVNGRGQFFSAEDPEELIYTLDELFENIAGRMASGASVAVNGEEIGTDTIIYQALYNSDGWTGDVHAFQVNSLTGEILKEEDEILWKATSGSDSADGLQSVQWDERRIVTYNGTTAGTPFRFDNLTDDQKSALDSDYATDDTTAKNLVEYIRGKEIDGFRTRTSKLGDVVHSAPWLVDNTLFVGGNDGMLHAFNAETGFERFAYVPNLVFDNLNNLANTDFSHLFYVDSTPYSRSRISDKTLLVGGLGKGGKGYYCLNVTSADDITAISDEDDVDDMVLWEYPKSGVSDDDMGYSYSIAYLVRTNLENSTWVVIFSNGYDSVNGNAVLYVLDALTGSVIRKIDTGSGSCNGLSTPMIIDVNNDNLADYAYAGDLQGNLWKFDLTGEEASEWDVAFKNEETPMPLFSASGQPITSRPDVMRHPDYHGYLVIFGTGRYLSSSDRLDVSQQSVYGIWDYGDDEDDSEYLGAITDRDTGALAYPSGITLQKQEVLEVENSCGDDYRILTDNEVQWQETDGDGNPIELEDDEDSGQDPNPVISAGWFFDFPNTGDEAGERVIKDVAIKEDRVIVLSFIPNSSLCSGGGDSYYYVMDAATGGRTDDAQVDVNGDGAIDDSDLCETCADEDCKSYAATGTKYTGMLHSPKYVSLDDEVDRAYISTSAGTIQEVNIKGENLGIYYWREN